MIGSSFKYNLVIAKGHLIICMYLTYVQKGPVTIFFKRGSLIQFSLKICRDLKFVGRYCFFLLLLVSHIRQENLTTYSSCIYT